MRNVRHHGHTGFRADGDHPIDLEGLGHLQTASGVFGADHSGVVGHGHARGSWVDIGGNDFDTQVPRQANGAQLFGTCSNDKQTFHAAALMN